MSADERIGQRLGPCRIERLLGEGGAGCVYLAHHLRLERPVALKVIAPRYAENPRALARFRREAQLAGKLSHPNLAQVLDLGEVDGAHYMIQELVDGRSLFDQVKDSGPLSIDETLRLGAGLASGLTALHDAGILHRDLKPANVVLTPEGGKLVDFGLAREVESEDPRLTRAGALLGTPLYMSPEQLHADDAVGPPTDVYGLGGILFFALTGEAPFPADDSPALDLLMQRLDTPARDVRGVRAEVPESLANLLTRLLATDPAARPEALEVQRELVAQRRKGAPVTRTEPGLRADTWKTVALVGGLLLVVAVLILAGTRAPSPVATAPTSQPSPQPSLPTVVTPTPVKTATSTPPQATTPTPRPSSPIPTPSASDPKAFGAFLQQLRALELKAARPALAKLRGLPPAERSSATSLLKLLETLNATAPLPEGVWPPNQRVLAQAPRTLAVVIALDPDCISAYYVARRAAELGGAEGTRNAIRQLGPPPLMERDLEFLSPARKQEVPLLYLTAHAFNEQERGRPMQSVEALTQALEHPVLKTTALGKRLAPWLTRWRSQLQQ